MANKTAIFNLNDFLSLEVPTSPSLSPDGQSCLYTTRLKWDHKPLDSEHHASAIWLAKTGEPQSARKITPGTFHDRSPQWSPDGQSIAFLSDRGGRRGKAQAIYQLHFGWEGPQPITPEAAEGTITSFGFSPDGKHMAYVAVAEQNPREDGKDARVWGSEWHGAELRIVDMARRTVETISSQDGHVAGFAWNDDGTEVAYVTHKTPDVESAFVYGASVRVWSMCGGAKRSVCVFPRGVTGDLVWQGCTLFVLSYNEPDDNASGLAVYSIDLASDHYSKIACGAEASETSPTRLLKAGSRILVHEQRGLVDQVRDLQTGTLLLAKPRTMLDVAAAVLASETDVVLATAEGDVNTPTEILATRVSLASPSLNGCNTLGTAKPPRSLCLSSHGNAFANKRLGACAMLSCRSLDGAEELQALFLTPTQHATLSGRPNESLPTVVLMHDGPYDRVADAFDSGSFLHLVIPFLLDRGYGCLLPNYRGSSGRGARFASYQSGGMGKYDEPDVVALTQAAIDQGFADKRRLVAGGWSQGGHLAYLSAVRNGSHGRGWRFLGLFAGAGVTDWESMTLTSDIGHMQGSLAGGTPWTLPKDSLVTRQGSALWEFRDAASESRLPPMLILHGEQDERVPISQAHGFRRALEAAGIPFEMVTYPREGHCLEDKRHVEDAIIRTVRFIEELLSSSSVRTDSIEGADG